jgi:hypothetical protein
MTRNRRFASVSGIIIFSFIIFCCCSLGMITLTFGGTAQIDRLTSQDVTGRLVSDPVLTNTVDGTFCTMIIENDSRAEVFRNIGSIYYLDADVATPCTIYKTGDSIKGIATGFSVPRLGWYRNLVRIEPIE